MFEDESYNQCLNCFIELRRDLLNVYYALVHSSSSPLEVIAAVEKRIDLVEPIIARLMALQELGPLEQWTVAGVVIKDEGKVKG